MIKTPWVRYSFIGTISILGFILMPACTDLFFVPTKRFDTTPDRLGLTFTEQLLQTPDGETLHGWELATPGAAKGYVLAIHGNAKNIGNHIFQVAKLPEDGYRVFIFDYRGYGRSTGSANVSGAIVDTQVALQYAASRAQALKLPLFVLGQSLGGSLGVSAISTSPEKQLIQALVIDSAFASYRRIAREKLQLTKVLYPVAGLLALLVSDEDAPELSIGALSQIPILFLHSEHDGIVPKHHGVELYQRAVEGAVGERELVMTAKPGHVQMLHDPEIRIRVLAFFDKHGAIDFPG